MPCNISGCKFTTQVSNSNRKSHVQKFHSSSHKIFHTAQGTHITVKRQSPCGKLECVCKKVEHERYNADRIRQMAKADPHPSLNTVHYNDPDLPEPLPGPTSCDDGDIKMIDIPEQDNTPSLAEKEVEDDADDIFLGDDDFHMESHQDSEDSSGSDLESEQSEENVQELPSDPHTYLARFNITVEPTYRLSICISCARPIPHLQMWSHQYNQHYRGYTIPPEMRLPSQSEIQAKLQELGADNPLPLPVEPILPLPGVQLFSGIKCSITGCNGAVYLPFNIPQ
ncbi:hypothetical protein GGU11DRAFT_823462 [Lentinula aff. detonsa]|nr:hypothetical protein GGU11DRAFT_823462 [Lentinula aff. detonsa]